MRFYHNLIQLAVTAVGFATLACSETIIETDMREENYVHNFINKFGLPDSNHDWSMAKTNTFTVETKNCLNVALMARIGNEEYLFADLGAVSGRTQFIANLPTKVDRLFIRVNGEEDYDVQPGKTFNIDAARSLASRADGLSPTEELGMKVTVMLDSKPEISILGQIFTTGTQNYTELMRSFEFGKDYLSVLTPANKRQESDFYSNFRMTQLNPVGVQNGKFADVSHINFYPLFSRPNKYNENDYVVGVYVRYKDDGSITHYDICRPGELNATEKTRWIDEADDTKTIIGNNEWFRDKLNDKRITDGGNFIHMLGKRIELSGFRDDDEIGKGGEIGFYIKSGIDDFNDKIAPNHCKYKHISYSECQYNKEPWEYDDLGNRTPCYYDVPLDKATCAYSGAITQGTATLEPYTSTKWKVNAKIHDDYDHAFIPKLFWLGFNSAPVGVNETSADFCDFIMLIETPIGTWGNRQFTGRASVSAFPWLLAAEDLGGTDDWDFNDLIVSVCDVTTNMTASLDDSRGYFPVPPIMARKLTVTPIAAGATLPDYLMFEGLAGSADIKPTTRLSEIGTSFTHGTYIVGTEIHNWLGEPNILNMLNTTSGITHRGRGVSFIVPLDHDKIDFNKPIADYTKANSTMAGFWVMVDSEDKGMFYTTTGLDTDGTDTETVFDKALTPFTGRLGDGIYSVNAPNSSANVAPQMILCHRSWYWPKERVSIADAWPQFTDWVKDKSVVWHSNGIETDLGEYKEELVIPHSQDDVKGEKYYTENPN